MRILTMEDLETRVFEMEKEIARIDAELPHLKESLDQNTKSFNQLNETLRSFEKTMIHMSDQMAGQTKSLETQQKALDKVVTDVNALKDKIETIDEKGKFDIREFFKKYFPWIVVLIGIGVFVVSSFIKF